MASDRMEILRSMVAQNPADSFARYGLAMEHVKAGQFEQAVEQFRELLAVNPNYAAAYFHGGQALEKLGRIGRRPRTLWAGHRDNDAHRRRPHPRRAAGGPRSVWGRQTK